MLEDDVIEEVSEASPWTSNLEMVPKKSGELKVWCDLREVNKAVIRERYILPRVDDTRNQGTVQSISQKIDAKSGFFQLPSAKESRNVTTFITPRGFFRFKGTPFDLGDAGEAFQKMMEEILFGIDGVQISIATMAEKP